MRNKGITLLCLLLAVFSRPHPGIYALDATNHAAAATCSLKDNCDLNDQLLTVGGEKKVGDSAKHLEGKIASVFEDKVNYSMQIFTEETILEYNALEGTNISAASALSNFTHQFTLVKSKEDDDNDDDDVIESEREYLYSIGQKLISIGKPFDASRNPDASELCRLHTRQFMEGLNNFDLWALKLHDSTGKLNSGILNGNINQLGDFDQCLRVQHQMADGGATGAANVEMKGQYCLAYAQPELPHKSKRLQTFFNMVRSHGPFRSEFDDPGHRVPRFFLINWGICVPSSCSHKDVEYTVREYLNNVTESTGVSFKVRVEPQMCQVKDNKPWDSGTVWAVRFFTIILSITILSTVYHVCTKNKKPNDWLVAFSLDKNLRWLFNTSSSPEDIEAVHGLRLLNAVMLLFSHKSMAIFFNPYDNRTEMAEALGQPWTVVGRAASLYTDPFLLFSGMLTAYSFFGRLNKGQTIKLKNEYINRFIRIVPPLGALILFCTFILPMLGSGPQWNLVVGHHADICKKNWWRNLLFIHNYFGFSNMCLTHTHHLGIDTQLFAVAPFMIFAMWKWPRKGAMALVALALIATFGRYYVTVFYELSNYIYFGTNIKRLFRTADRMYSFPPLRSTVYIMGIFLGFALRKCRGIKLSKTQLYWGWFVAIASLLISLLGPAPMGSMSYQYNSTHSAIYAAFVPITWCIFFVWVVFVSHNGYTNFITDLCSWKGFQVSTKLSYAIYLTQFPAYFFNVGRRRHVHHYYNFVSIMLDTNEYLCIFIASVVLTVLFDAPFQNIRKLLTKRTPTAVASGPADTTNTKSVTANGSISKDTITTPSKHLHSE
ncbi:O-acyltransferase like protein [Musca domestica]|uniref:O-acyltransferase like protein n=1 Tax=Musca domestica TaxID=7370 RepID=A0A1I8N9P9_MUSDO|nr:O-acyltransferase like protein [Musca domestica]XP_058976939.1 O-acyltransferase like protein [Musca domestica]